MKKVRPKLRIKTTNNNEWNFRIENELELTTSIYEMH